LFLYPTTVTLLRSVCLGVFALTALSQTQLPTPSLTLPSAPKIHPMVITAGGQRLLLNQTDLVVSYDPQTRRLTSNRPGWWIVNFPLERVENFDGPVAALSQLLFDVPQEYVRNWYLKTPGTPVPEPPAPTGPARIDLTPEPAIFVDQRSANASDTNPGTADEPLRTIGAAVRRAGPGTVIRVNYGIYRERVIIETSGTADHPIRIEGVRSAEGMPVIDGNDPLPGNAWSPTEWAGVYRANFGPTFEGPLSVGPEPLIERSWPGDLKPNEFAANRASRQFLHPAFDGSQRPAEGDVFGDRTWRRVRPDSTGMMDLNEVDGTEAGNSIYWASTWVWVEPTGPAAFDSAKPSPRNGDLRVEGFMRAFRATGAGHPQQVNKYRVWVNGAPLVSTVYSTAAKLEILTPHPSRNAGDNDEWYNFPLREGWNHLMLQLDTTVRPGQARWRFRFPDGIQRARTSAATPSNLNSRGSAAPAEWITEYLLLGPFPAQPDRGIYVRLPDDADPNHSPMEVAARGSELINVLGDYVHIRGFEVRNGSQFQQRPQVFLKGQGTLLEGTLMAGSEISGVICAADKDRSASPIVIRNNWIVNAGNVGFGCTGLSDQLTAENLNTTTPGRSTAIFEHNVILNSNWAGFPVVWSAGASKNVQISGLIMRYNTLIGGSGPGIWLDWENFGNRIEGNLIRDSYKFGIGVEASPGPNLIANNVLSGLRAEVNYFSALIASWDSSNTWTVNNTVNGRWNGGKGWLAPEAASGIDLGQGGTREIRFGPQSSPRQGYFNNLILGFERAITPRAGDDAQGNYSDSGSGGSILGRIPEFISFGLEDYRLEPASTLNRSGVRSAITDYLTHDFNGLIRHRAFPNSVGAFRAEPKVTVPTENVMEIEYEDGVQKLINAGPPIAALTPAGANSRRVARVPRK
jgi:hypothetical protein